ncbi:MAG TPA: methylenetetrahydrofolate reductase [Solirubrobacteraceae bacterium]|nr:methylenetetrahydrofolate reductase [Solirubrobacteraceae bacterium]
MAAVSFEVFPPRSAQAQARLWLALERLAPLRPDFVSVTCGAGGSDAAPTFDAVCAIRDRTAVTLAGHLTCAGRTRADVDELASRYWAGGVRHIVALRGDMPQAGERFVAHPSGYEGSIDLIEGIRRIAPFEVSVAAYPEPHPESRSLAADLEVLARKADAGASRAITQFCFDTGAIARLRDRVADAGIGLDLVPGILVPASLEGLLRMSQRCGASVPRWLRERFDGLDRDPHACKLVAAIVTAGQVEELRREGFEHFHFYTLNDGEVVAAVCRLLGIKETLAVAA